MYKTIKENISAEIVEKKSKFIANVFYIESREEAEDIIKSQKKKYHDARHNCYAYRVLENSTVIEKSAINENKKVNEMTKQERHNLVRLLKNIEFTVKGTRPVEEAIITSGGINIKEINPSTMESKIVKDLYFAGEIIDVDAYTGGFNLQIAYSTGYTAGLLK